MRKTFYLLGLSSILLLPSLLFAASGYGGSQPIFTFPLGGGRAICPTINAPNQVEMMVGYLVITSTDANKALNPDQDQQDVNQMLTQVKQLYIESYQQYGPNTTYGSSQNYGSSQYNNTQPANNADNSSPPPSQQQSSRPPASNRPQASNKPPERWRGGR
jgi:hypothetical protein